MTATRTAIVSFLIATAGALMSHAPHAQVVADARSLSLVLLLDVSFSMTPYALAEDDRFPAVLNTVDGDLGPDDTVAVGRVTDRAVIAPFVHRGALLDEWKRLPRVPPAERFGPSPVWDALDAAVSTVAPRQEVRAVVLWTDGQPTGNRLSLDEVTARARGTGVALYAIVDDRAPALVGGSRMGIDNPCAVFGGVEQTGGRCLLNRRSDKTPAAELHDTIKSLRTNKKGR